MCAFEILLFKVFINACKLTGEMPIDWSFSLVFDIQQIHFQYLQQIEIYLDHQYNESLSKKIVVLHSQQNNSPDTKLIFLDFSF